MINRVKRLSVFENINQIKNFWCDTNLKPFWRVSWSQHGEDLVLLSLLRLIEIEQEKLFGYKNLIMNRIYSGYKGSYLDIGAHHPRRFSNTRLLYDLGWSGVNVDASERNIKLFQKERSRDINLTYLVSLPSKFSSKIKKRGGEKKPFLEFNDGALSTGNLRNMKKLKKMKTEKTKLFKISYPPIVTLEYLLNRYFADKRLDVLLVDCEKMDLEVLKSGYLHKRSLKMLPRFIIVEMEKPLWKMNSKSPTFKYLSQVGYEILQILPLSVIFGIRRKLPSAFR